MQVKINDLSKHITPYLDDIKTRLNKVVDSSWFLLGNETNAFEEDFASFIGVKNCISVANGTDALEMGLKAIGVKPGDKVITVANAGAYTTVALHLIGAVPVYVDVDEAMNMDIDSLKSALTEHGDIKAVVVTHLYGNIALGIKEIAELCKAKSIPLLEDCAQAHGASFEDKKAGSWGDIATFSFYPTKNLGAIGDAGAVVTNNADLAEKVKKIRQYGWSKKYEIDLECGRNSRMDEMQATILNFFLTKIDQWTEARRQIAKKYISALANLSIEMPVNQGQGSVFHLFIIRLDNREKLADYLKENGIQTDVHYPVPDHEQEIMKNRAFFKVDLAKTEDYSKKILTLPCYPELSSEEQDYVIEKIKAFYA
jgi:aminotransferase EvaB